MYLYKTNKGLAGNCNQLNSNGIEVGLCFNDIAIALGYGGRVIRFANGAWTEIYDNGDLSSNEGNLVFVDSRGYVFISFDGPTEDLFRSTDNGLTFTSCLTAPTDDNFRMVTEDDRGGLYAAAYSAALPTRTPSFWKSTDGGDTWANIYGNLANTYNRHMHAVYFCPHRKTVFVSGGDSGTAYPQYSTDYGETWTSWTDITQATGFTSDDKYIYIAADASDDRDIYRSPTAGGIMESVLVPPEPVVSDNGFCWDMYREGNFIIAPFCQAATDARMFVSDNNGNSWKILNNQSGATADNNRFGYYRAQVSPYNSSFSGLRIHGTTDAASGATYAWRIMDDNQNIEVNELTGKDTGDGVLVPKKEIFDHEPLQKYSAIELRADYSSPVRLSECKWIDGGFTYGLTSAPPIADDTAQADFTAGFGDFAELNINGGTVTIAAGVMTCDTTTGTGIQTIGAFADEFSAVAAQGDEIWMRGTFTLNDAISADTPIMGIRGGALDFFVELDQSKSNAPFVSIYDTVNGQRDYVQDSISPPITISTSTAYTVRVRVKAHDTQGRLTLWLNDVCVVDIIGIRTTDTVNNKLLDDPWFGLRTTQVGISTTWDNIICTLNKDPDLNASAELAGTGQQARSLKQDSQTFVVGGTDNAAIACTSQSASVLPYKLTGTRAAFHNGVITGSSAAIENDSATGSVYNSVFSGQAVQVITETQVCTTDSNTYDTGGTLVATPGLNDIAGANHLDSNLKPISRVPGVYQRLLYDADVKAFYNPPNRGAYEFREASRATAAARPAASTRATASIDRKPRL